MYLFDTNIFLEILLAQRNLESAKKCLTLLGPEKRGLFSSFSFHAIEAIVGARKRRGVLIDFIHFFVRHPYLERYDTSLEEELEIAQLSSQINLDFDDSAQYYIAKKFNLALVTFDADFKKLKDIQVIYP